MDCHPKWIGNVTISFERPRMTDQDRGGMRLQMPQMKRREPPRGFGKFRDQKNFP